MSDNKACQLFVLDKCYTKQKLTNVMMANKERQKFLGQRKKMHLDFLSFRVLLMKWYKVQTHRLFKPWRR